MEKDSTNQDDLFDRRYRNQLSREELRDFETKLKEDSKFSEDYDTYLSMITAIKLERREKLRKKLNKVSSKLENEGFFEKQVQELNQNKEGEIKSKKKIFNINKRSRYKRWISAASLLLLFSFSGYNIQQHTNSGLSNLQSEVLVPDVGQNLGEEKTDIIKQAKAAIHKSNSQEAIKILKEVKQENDLFIDAQYYLAYANYQEKNYKNSIQYTDTVLGQSDLDIELRNKTEWLQLQAMLLNGDTESSKFQDLLSTIASNKNHLFNTQANNLKNSLQSFWRKFIF